MENAVAVCISCSKAYISPLCAMIDSLCNANPSYEFDFYFIGSPTPRIQARIIKTLRKSKDSLTICPFDLASFRDCPNFDIWGQSYVKVMIPLLLPETIKKALWLDSDIIVTGDISGLLSTEFHDKTLVAIGGGHEPNRKFVKLADGTLCDSYKLFNAGVMFFDLEKFRSQHNKEEYLQAFHQHSQNYRYADQDFFFLYFHDNCISLKDDRYNYLIGEESDKTTMLEKSVLHFYTQKKPWLPHYTNSDAFKLYWKYASAHFRFSYRLYLRIEFVLRNAVKRVFRKRISN